jgi:hypothetical protein
MNETLRIYTIEQNYRRANGTGPALTVRLVAATLAASLEEAEKTLRDAYPDLPYGSEVSTGWLPFGMEDPMAYAARAGIRRGEVRVIKGAKRKDSRFIAR